MVELLWTTLYGLSPKNNIIIWCDNMMSISYYEAAVAEWDVGTCPMFRLSVQILYKGVTVNVVSRNCKRYHRNVDTSHKLWALLPISCEWFSLQPPNAEKDPPTGRTTGRLHLFGKNCDSRPPNHNWKNAKCCVFSPRARSGTSKTLQYPQKYIGCGPWYSITCKICEMSICIAQNVPHCHGWIGIGNHPNPSSGYVRHGKGKIQCEGPN